MPADVDIQMHVISESSNSTVWPTCTHKNFMTVPKQDNKFDQILETIGPSVFLLI